MCKILKELIFDLDIIFTQIENMNINEYEKLLIANVNINTLLAVYYKLNLIPSDLIVRFYLTKKGVFEYDFDENTL